jgi:hypothetical protein
MQIVGVAGVNDSHVATGESVLMGVLLMLAAYAHRDPPGCEGIEFPNLTRSIAALPCRSQPPSQPVARLAHNEHALQLE